MKWNRFSEIAPTIIQKLKPLWTEKTFREAIRNISQETLNDTLARLPKSQLDKIRSALRNLP